MTYNGLEDTWFQFVVAATGLPENQGRIVYQNGPIQSPQDRPLLFSLALINATMIGQDGRINSNGASDVDEKITSDRNITASIKTYGPEARDNLEKVNAYLSASAGIEFLNKNQIGFFRSGQILDISSIQNGEFEDRRSLDIEFHAVFETTRDVNAINSAEIDYTFFGAETVTGTIEVHQ